jgi:hypothetical protein
VKHSTREFALLDVMQKVSTGEVALPEFQRPFVWDPGQVIELLESVAHGWPIGSLLLLEGPQPFRVKNIDGGPEVNKATVRLHILDGQQRVTGLFHALADVGDTVYYVDFSKIDEFEEAPRIRYTARKKYELSGLSFTIRELTSTSAMKRRLEQLSREEGNELRRYAGTLVGHLDGNYAFSAIVLQSDIDLEALTRIFETLNRTGMKLDAFDLMVALLYPSNFDLRQEWVDAVEEFELLKKHKTSGLEILRLIALWEWSVQRSDKRPIGPRSVTGVRQRDVLALRPDRVMKQWRPAVLAYNEALDFMRRYCGLRPGNLPSTAMVLTLAYYLSDDVDRHQILKWYWRSVIDQTYAQGANTQILSDVAHGARNVTTFNSRSVLNSALRETTRRSRILRLGLRGAAIVGHVADPFTGRLISDRVLDVSVADVDNNAIHYSSTNAVVDLIFYEPVGRSAKPPEGAALHGDAMLQQGFPPVSVPQERLVMNRVDAVHNWIGEWLE